MIDFKNILYYFCIVIFMWIAFSTSITRFKNKQMSETELFLHIPKSFILDFNK